MSPHILKNISILFIVLSLLLGGCASAQAMAPQMPLAPDLAPVVESAAPVLAAIPEVGVVAGTSYAVGAATYDSYVDNCIPKEAYQAFTIQFGGYIRLRICDEVAPREQIPGASDNHHSVHDDTPDNPDAQRRWQAARDRYGNWNKDSQWHDRPTAVGQDRCGATYLDGQIIRVAIYSVYKLTEKNVFGNMVVFLPYDMGQVTSFTDARWEQDFLRPARDLATTYGNRVTVGTLNCYDLVSMGLTVPPAP